MALLVLQMQFWLNVTNAVKNCVLEPEMFKDTPVENFKRKQGCPCLEQVVFKGLRKGWCLSLKQGLLN